MLIGGAADLADGAGVAELGVRGVAPLVHQDVDARHVGVGGHGQAVGRDARPGPLVLPVVAGEGQAVVRGVGVIGLGPVLDEQVEEGGVEVVADPLPVPGLLDQGDEVGPQVVAPAGLEGREQGRGVVDGVGAAGRGDLGLVLEDAGHGLAELRPDHGLVAVEGQVEELLGDVFAHDVDVGEAAVPGRRGGLDDVEDEVLGGVRPLRRNLAGDVLDAGQGAAQDHERRGVERGRRRAVEGPQPEARAGRVGHGRGHVAAGEPGRVGVLVVEPDLEAEPLAFLDGVGAEGEPLVRKVGRDEAGPGVDESPADAPGLEVLELALDLLAGHKVVPDPERGAAVLGRGIGEGGPDGVVGRSFGFLRAGREHGGGGGREEEAERPGGDTAVLGHGGSLSRPGDGTADR